MSPQSTGVIITLREIYESVNTTNKVIERMEAKLLNLEEKSIIALEANERSQEALITAKQAYQLAKEVSDMVEQFKELKENQRKWFWRTVFTAILPYILATIAALMFLWGGIGNGGL